MRRSLLLLAFTLSCVSAQATDNSTMILGNMDALITAIKSIPGVVGSTGPAGSGGGGVSTVTITLDATGDVFLSTNPNDNGAAYINNVGTFNITSAWAYQTVPSTVPGYVSTFTVVITTVIAVTGTNNTLVWTGMDSSSWVVNSQTLFSTDTHKPSITSVINAQQTVFMLQMTDTTVLGVAPRGVWGMKLRGWWSP